jgi:serine/threonine protein kinase
VNVIRKNTGATGTISYCAPEVLRQDSSGRYGNFTAKSDIFSLGMILYFMCFSRLPYSSAENIQEEFEDLDQLRAEISTWSGFQEERQERPDLPDQLYSFLKRLLALNPLDRPSATEILQAISTGTGLDAPNLGRRNSNINVSKRIQPIDSPAPGTPVPGQRSRSAAYIEDDGDISIKSSSAESSLPHIKADSEPRKFLSEGRDRSPGPGPLTPLLMPPPSTRLTTFRNRADVLKHRAYHFALLNRRLILGTLRLVIFLVKVYTLAKPCLPYATNPIIGVSLLLLAAYDLGQGVSMEWRVTTALMMAHFVVLGVARRQGVLCARNEDLWRDEWP